MLEAAATIYITDGSEGSCEKALGVLDEMLHVENSVWLAHGKEVCNRLKEVMKRSNAENKGPMIEKLGNVLANRIDLNRNPVPITTTI